MVTAGATSNITQGNRRASRESGVVFTFTREDTRGEGRARHSHELQIDLSAPAAFYVRLVLETSCVVNAPRPT